MTTKPRLLKLTDSNKVLTRLRGYAFVFAFTVILISCDKDPEAAKITGKWTGTTSIWKRTTSMNGSVLSEGSDTTFWGTPGFTTSLEFKGDSVAFIYIKPNRSMDFRGLDYVFNVDRLQFYNNPFSYRSSDPQFGLYQNPPADQRNLCFVTELTANRMVLYDKDTINRNPLIVWQQWTTFIK